MRQEFTQEIERTARAVVNEAHTAIPGEIVSFDAEKCTATVRPIGKFVTVDGKALSYPKIAEVPVVFPYSSIAKVGIAFPVKGKDTCLIIISEVELDEWRNGAESEGSLRFDLTNAVAIPGLLTTGSDLISKATKEGAVVIASPEAEISVGKDSASVTVGTVELTVSKSGITARGDFKVEGNISYTGALIGG